MSDEKEIRIDITDGNEPAETEKSDRPKAAVDAEPDKADKESAESKPEEVVADERSEEEKLRERLALAEEKLLLAQADFENFKKRQARRQEDFYRTANDGLLGRILDVIDNFERAIAHAGESRPEAEANAANGLLDGTKMILKQLHDILGHYQVVPIEAIGQPFDPNLHEALMQVESAEYDEGLNSIEIARGYKAGDRVLRHSKVGVSKGAPKPESEEKSETDSPDNNQETE